MRKAEWQIMKSFIDSRLALVNYLDLGSLYWVKATDYSFSLECEIDKNPSDTTDLNDFEENYMPIANARINDGDGDQLVRLKIAPRNWNYQALQFEASLGKYDSFYCKKQDGSTDVPGFTYKIYDGSDNEITSSLFEANSVKTVITYEPTYDFCLVAGRVDQISIVASDCRLWVVAAPDIPEGLGGSKVFVNGINLRFFDSILTEGRSPKRLNYSATYHTNKLQFIFRHGTTFSQKVSVILDMYKL